MSNLNEALSRNLKIARSYLGWSQKDLAERLATSQSTYSQYEVCARLPHVERLVELAQALGQSVDALLGLAPLVQVEAVQLLKRMQGDEAKARRGRILAKVEATMAENAKNEVQPKPEKPRKGVVL